ncbi:unnamed protein product [Prunus brigantina]
MRISNALARQLLSRMNQKHAEHAGLTSLQIHQARVFATFVYQQRIGISENQQRSTPETLEIGRGGVGPLHPSKKRLTECLVGSMAHKEWHLANVDPIDVARNIARLNPETTLVVVVLKTFTTAETMLNVQECRV